MPLFLILDNPFTASPSKIKSMSLIPLSTGVGFLALSIDYFCCVLLHKENERI